MCAYRKPSQPSQERDKMMIDNGNLACEGWKSPSLTLATLAKPGGNGKITAGRRPGLAKPSQPAIPLAAAGLGLSAPEGTSGGETGRSAISGPVTHGRRGVAAAARRQHRCHRRRLASYGGAGKPVTPMPSSCMAVAQAGQACPLKPQDGLSRPGDGLAGYHPTSHAFRPSWSPYGASASR